MKKGKKDLEDKSYSGKKDRSKNIKTNRRTEDKSYSGKKDRSIPGECRHRVPVMPLVVIFFFFRHGHFLLSRPFEAETEISPFLKCQYFLNILIYACYKVSTFFIVETF
jgi:hypothetical protein